MLIVIILGYFAPLFKSSCVIGGITYSGYTGYNCDPRCIETDTADAYCCQDSTHTSNYDCANGCNTNSAKTFVGNVYLWPDTKRCDTTCPSHWYVLAGSSSGTVCSQCHSWCLECTDQYCYTCTSCDPTAYRLNSTACYNIVTQSYGVKNPCTDGYYGLHIQKICVACPTGTAQCAIYLTW